MGTINENENSFLLCKLKDVADHPEGTISRRQCRGIKRNTLQKQLRKEKVLSVRAELIRERDKPSVPSEQVLRKIRSQSLEKNIFGILEDIHGKEGTHVGLGNNFNVQINRNVILNKWKQSGDNTLYIDATGSVCKKPAGKYCIG